MKALGLFLMVIRYLICWPLAWATNLLTWIIAPILALPCFVTYIDGREWLIKPLRWFQTHDNPVDEWWATSDNKYFEDCFLFKGITVEDFKRSSWLRYLGRYFWICRNPAYGFAYNLYGFMQTASFSETTVYEIPGWQTGHNNISVELGVSPEANLWMRYTYHIRAQWFFFKAHYLHVNIGWKGHRGFNGRIVAALVTPFRTWD